MKIDQNTKLYGVVGYPLSHSLSPLIQNSTLLAMNVNAVYLAFETNDIAACLQWMKSLDIKGLSVTIPYKSSVLPPLNEIDGLADRIGAVTTIVNDNGRLVGYNTEAIGAIRALEEKIDNPLETRFLTMAKERGCLAINGLGMFIHQGQNSSGCGPASSPRSTP